jgi:hypothetical protein
MKEQDKNIEIIKIYYLHRGDNIPFYVGKTKDSLKKRVYGHIKKYGKGVQIEELDLICDDNWKFWESWWIELIKLWGFTLVNQNQGGGGVKQHDFLTKEKISNTWKSKSKIELDNINEKRRQANKGIPKPGAGRKIYTLEQKIALGNRGYYKSEGFLNKCRKPISMLDKNTEKIIKEFNSITEAALYINVTQSTLSTCLTGRSKTSGGYKWMYKGLDS